MNDFPPTIEEYTEIGFTPPPPHEAEGSEDDGQRVLEFKFRGSFQGNFIEKLFSIAQDDLTTTHEGQICPTHLYRRLQQELESFKQDMMEQIHFQLWIDGEEVKLR